MKRPLSLGAGALVVSIAAGAAGAKPASAPARRVQPDLELVSATLTHTRLAPDTNLGVMAVVRATGSTAPPLSVGIYLEGGDDAVVGRGRRLGTLTYDKGLPPGRQVTLQASVRVPPCERCTPMALKVVVDPGNVVAERVETNNERTLPVEVSPTFRPDLVVERVSVTPDRGSIEGTVTVRGVVRNASKVFAEGPFRVSVVCAGRAEVTPGDPQLYSFRVPSLPPGQEVKVERAVKLGPRCGVRALSTWIGIVADDQAAVKESNEQNGARAAAYWVYRAPDLGTRPLDVSATVGPPGQRMLMTYRVSNKGGAAAGPFETGVFFTRAGAKVGSGIVIDRVAVPSLAANTDSGLVEHAFVIPPDTSRGRYELGVVVDLAGTNGELRKRNNFRVAPFTVTDTNLTDAYFTAQQKEAAPGSTVELRLRVKQPGADGASRTTARIYYSEDPRFDPTVDVPLGEIPLGAIGARAESPEKTLTVTVPPRATEGYHFLLAVLDAGDEIAETNERDNVVLESLRVVAP